MVQKTILQKRIERICETMLWKDKEKRLILISRMRLLLNSLLIMVELSLLWLLNDLICQQFSAASEFRLALKVAQSLIRYLNHNNIWWQENHQH